MAKFKIGKGKYCFVIYGKDGKSMRTRCGYKSRKMALNTIKKFKEEHIGCKRHIIWKKEG